MEVAGLPLIAHQLRWLAGQGVDRVVVSCGYQWRRIEAFVGDGSNFGAQVSYAVEETPLGRGGGLRNALGQLDLDAGPIVACNGDVLTALPLPPMLAAHRRSGATATLLLVPFVSQHGLVDVDARGRIAGFREKPSLPYWLSGGVYVLTPEVEALLPRKGDQETTTWPKLARAGKLHGHRYRGFWQPVDSAKDVREAEASLPG